MQSPITANLYAITDPVHLTDTIHALITSILFTRAFGTIKCTSNSFLGISYAGFDYPELEEIITGKVQQIQIQVEDEISLINKTDSVWVNVIIMIKFYETVLTQSGSIEALDLIAGVGGSQRQRRGYVGSWEQWIINVDVFIGEYLGAENVSPLTEGHAVGYTINDRVQLGSKFKSMKLSDRLGIYAKQFETNLFSIVAFNENNKDHIPSITSKEILPFPIRLEYFCSGDSDSQELDSAMYKLDTSFQKGEIDLGSLLSADNSWDIRNSNHGDDSSKNNNKNTDSNNNNNNNNNNNIINKNGTGTESSSDSPINNSGFSQESLEYIATTDAGDVIMGSFSGKAKRAKFKFASNPEHTSSKEEESLQTHDNPKIGDELWKNGYKFFKKMLE
ncbi:hypothetical protein DAMA08_046830 [Martiniozyma asiatica (nom. inval.)]|nr:hypothetical protein DAMA08_046830 [Martiniozyma asiatica]